MTNAQKTPLGRSLNDWGKRKVAEAIWSSGRALPATAVSANGALITVEFSVQSGFTLPQITVPLFGPRYIRYPIQPGDAGVVFPADAQLGPVSGQTTGAANLAQPGNLGALVFFPIGNAKWVSVNPNQLDLTAPGGIKAHADSGSAQFEILPDQITLSAGGHSIVINSSGVTIDGKVFLAHEHSGVQTGGSNTGGVA